MTSGTTPVFPVGPLEPDPDTLRAADRAKAAGVAAVRNMAADWYCPFDPERQRIDCPECIAEVALDAALGAEVTGR